MTLLIGFPLEYELKIWVRLFQILLGAVGIAYFLLLFAQKATASPVPAAGKEWVSALDTVRVLQSGAWWVSQSRYAETGLSGDRG